MNVLNMKQSGAAYIIVHLMKTNCFRGMTKAELGNFLKELRLTMIIYRYMWSVTGLVVNLVK